VSDWKDRLGQTARDVAKGVEQAAREVGGAVQQGVDHLSAQSAAAQRATVLAWPPSANGVAAVVGVPLTSLTAEDGPESTVWRVGGSDERGHWQFEVHQGRLSVLSPLASGPQGVVGLLAARHTWQWPVAEVGDGAVVCQDEGRVLQAVCYASSGDAVRWATAWVPQLPPDPRDLAVSLVRAIFAKF